MKTLLRAAPPRARIASRARRMCGASTGSPIIFKREIGLDAGAHVEGAVVEQRPAAVRALDAAEIGGDLRLERQVGRLAAEMA